MKSVKVNERFIAASFCQHPEICVWDAKTKELVIYYLHVYYSFTIRRFLLYLCYQLTVMDAVPEEGNQLDGEYGKFYSKEFCLWNNLLLSCQARISVMKVENFE